MIYGEENMVVTARKSGGRYVPGSPSTAAHSYAVTRFGTLTRPAHRLP